MNSLPVTPHLPVKNRVLIPRHHLALRRHLGPPPVKRGDRSGGSGSGTGGWGDVLGQGLFNDVDDLVDRLETSAVAEFLRRGEAEWDFPGRV